MVKRDDIRDFLRLIHVIYLSTSLWQGLQTENQCWYLLGPNLSAWACCPLIFASFFHFQPFQPILSLLPLKNTICLLFAYHHPTGRHGQVLVAPSWCWTPPPASGMVRSICKYHLGQNLEENFVYKAFWFMSLDEAGGSTYLMSHFFFDPWTRLRSILCNVSITCMTRARTKSPWRTNNYYLKNVGLLFTSHFGRLK